LELTSLSGRIEQPVSPIPGGVRYYRLSAINSCNQAVVISNPVTLMRSYLRETGNSVILYWNSFLDWTGGVENYSVYRSLDGIFEMVATVSPADTAWMDDPYSFIYETTGDSICYYVTAFEGANPYFQDAESKSTEVCIAAPVKIYVPNGFTPDGDGVNDLFSPVLSFTPERYQLIIKSRSGTTLFETRDPFSAWDGKYGGDKLQQDAYLWFLEVVTPGGKTLSRHGVVTIIFN
jgi:gliding motility-associated-like protein